MVLKDRAKRRVATKEVISMNTQSHENIVKNIQGSFAVENIMLSEKSLSNLKRLAMGNIDVNSLIEEIASRYSQKGV